MPTVSPFSFRSRICMAMLALGLAVPMGARAQSVPDVFQVAPVKADAFLVIPKLSQLSQKIAILNESLNLNQPPMADAMAEFKRQFGIGAGLNEDGSFLIVFMKGLPLQGAPEPSESDILVFVPVTNYQAFVEGYKGGANELVTALTLPNQRKGFARRVGNFALLGSDRQVLEGYRPVDISAGLVALAGPLGLKCISDSDMSLIMIGKAARGGQAAAGAAAPGVSDLMNIANPDQTVSIMGFDLSELGIGMSAVGRYKEGSPTAKLFTPAQPAAKFMNKLPPDPAWVAGIGASFQGLDIAQLVKNQVDALTKASDPNIDFDRRVLGLVQNIQGTSLLLTPIAQAQGFQGSLFNGTIVVDTPNPKAYMAAVKSYIENLKDASVNLSPDSGGAGGAGSVLKFSTKYTPNALQVDGITVDQYEVNYIIPGNILQQLAQMQLLGLGAGGQNGYIAIASNHVIITTSPDAQIVRQALNAVKVDTGMGALPMVAQVRTFLPPFPVIEAFVSGGSVVSGINFARGMWKALPPVQIPANLPPIGLGVSVEPTGWMGKVFVPMPLAAEIYNDVLPMVIPGATPSAPAPTVTIQRRSEPAPMDPGMPGPGPGMPPGPPGGMRPPMGPPGGPGGPGMMPGPPPGR